MLNRNHSDLWSEQAKLKPAVKSGLLATIIIGVIAMLIALGFAGSYVTPHFDGLPTIVVNSSTLHLGPLPTNPTCTTGNDAYMILELNNPSNATHVSSIIITGASADMTITAYYLNGSTCTLISSMHGPGVNGGEAITSITLYFGEGFLSVFLLHLDKS